MKRVATLVIAVLLLGSVAAMAIPAGAGTQDSIADPNPTGESTHDFQSEPANPPNPTAPKPKENTSICIVYFYSPNCPHCQEVRAYLEHAQAEHDLRVKAYRAVENPQVYEAYADQFSVPESRRGKVPTVFVGDAYAVGSAQSMELIDRTIEARVDTGLACPSQADTDSPPPRLIGFVGLALVDAINPCAMAVLLILLTTIQTRHPERKALALKSGLSFVAGIFLMYFTIGILLILGLKAVIVATGFSIPGLYPVFGAVAILIGLLNVKDWISHGAGGFAMEVPFSWRPAMKEILETVSSPIGAFSASIGVSLFLLPCTSGPYIVAGGLLAEQAWPVTLSFLFLYNFVFVLPMIAIVGVVYGGFATVDRFTTWREANIERLHLLAGLLLIGLGTFLVLGPS